MRVPLRLEVTPFVGVWIETQSAPTTTKHRLVTPFVGVWIETKDCIMEMTDAKGHTLRGCVD